MTKLFECGTCGVVTDHISEVCSPVEVQGGACGTDKAKTAQMCTPAEENTYTCSSCGRPATSPELLCHPKRP